MFEFGAIVAYLVCTIAVGFFSARKKKHTLKEQFVASGSLGFGMLLPLLFGELIAGASTTGTATTGFTNGAIALYAIWGNCFGCIFNAIVLSKFFVAAGKSGKMTLPGIFAIRFGKMVKPVIVIIAILAAEVIFALQIKAAAVLMSPLINVDSTLIAWAVAGVFLLMALFGLKSVAGMNIVHSSVLFIGIFVVAVVCVNSVGGPQGLYDSLPASYFSLTSEGYDELVAKLGGTVLSFSVAAAPVNICLAAKNTRAARTSLVAGSLIGSVFAFLPLLIGMAGQIAMPEANSASILFLMPHSISPWLSLVAMVAVMAAVFSTGPFLLLYLCTLITRDMAMPLSNMSEIALYRFSKVIAVPFVLVALVLANRQATILTDLLGVAQMQAMCTVTLLVGLAWRKATGKAAVAAILISGILTLAWHFAGEPYGIMPFFVGLPVNIVIMVVVSLITCKGPESISYREFAEWKRGAYEQDTD